jgi:hypothetical protein
MTRTVLLLLLLLAAANSAAHQQKEAITRILFNSRTDNIEVMHRFLVHDAEHAVKALRKSDADILDSREDQKYFADYVHTNFAIADQEGRSMQLRPVGHEIEGRFFWVYSETAIPKDINILTLRHSALLDLWPEQVNLVNVEQEGSVRSATFMRGSGELKIELTAPVQ